MSSRSNPSVDSIIDTIIQEERHGCAKKKVVADEDVDNPRQRANSTIPPSDATLADRMRLASLYIRTDLAWAEKHHTKLADETRILQELNFIERWLGLR